MRWAAIAIAIGLALAPAAAGAPIVVTETGDVVAADGRCALREAVVAAATNAPFNGCPAGDAEGTDEVLLGAGVYELAIAGREENGGLAGDLDTGPGTVRVSGLGAGATVVDANGLDRTFDVPAGGGLTLEDLTVREGAGSSSQPDPGGAVRSFGTLTVRRAALRLNAAGSGGSGTLNGVAGQQGGGGGAIWSAGSLAIADTILADNRAGAGGDGGQGQGGPPGPGGPGGFGGAVDVPAGTAMIVRSAFVGNRAGAGGRGGLDLLNIPARAGGGGGGWAGALSVGPTAAASVENSTFEGNRAGDAGAGGAGTGLPGAGGAVLESLGGGALTVAWSTFSGNLRGAGSTGANGIAGAVTLAASIVADPPPACATGGGGFAAASVIIVITPGDASCLGPRREAAPSLGPLGDNGGPTPTMLPAPGSAAVDLLPASACPAVDQRGLPRPRFAGCDAGAAELQPAPAPGAPGAGSAPGGRAVLSGLRIVPRTIRPAGPRPRIGLVSFRVDRAATVVLRVRRLAPGRRVRAACVRPRPALRSARRCARRVAVPGRIVRAATPGPNTVRLTGRLGGRLLPPGRYELTARAEGGSTLTRGFRVVAWRPT